MQMPKPKYVSWQNLSESSKHRLMTEGHASNRPTDADTQKPLNKFAEDGSSWSDAYLLADVFWVPK